MFRIKTSHRLAVFQSLELRRFGVQDYGQFRVPLHETRVDALGLSNHFDMFETVHNLFPNDTQLHFGEAIPHTAV